MSLGSSSLQLWGGIECTVNRVGDRWFNQLERSGHAARAADLDRVAALGIRVLRYPALWELCAPDSPDRFEWSWLRARFTRLRALGIEPIAGLVHHGSGPRYTSLVSLDFESGLARYAEAFAAEFPWIEQYTPVNEPLTTARFSGLYGHWYPHGRDDRLFARALINQCRAIARSMRAIRRINPRARLVQTEDLGTTYSSPGMGYQAEFDNERRWLSWDLLCGRVDARHPLRAFLENSGIEPDELDALRDAPCPPDIIGINHYVTSDRFLDDELARYPPESHGSNGRQRYADVAAVRVLRGEYAGWRVIREAAQRYGIPITLTEVHIGCTRDEQIRWLDDAWTAAHAARRGGIDVRAVTAWALFGSYDWDSLLTVERGRYESGAFDVRAATPRETALAARIRELATGATGAIAATGAIVPLEVRGWWQSPAKLHYPRRTPKRYTELDV